MRIQPAETGFIPVSAQPAAPARPEAAQGAPAQAAGEKLSPQAAEDLVKQMNQALKSINTGLEFSLHEETGKVVVKVIDLETKKTLRQFPSEEALSIAQALDKLKGVLLRQSA